MREGRTSGPTETRQLREELAVGRALLDTVVRQMPDGVIVVDAATHHIVFANAQAEEITRSTLYRDAPVTDSPWRLFRADGSPARTDDWPIVRALRTGAVVIAEELEVQRGDGTRGLLSVRAAPVRDREGQVVAVVAVFRDVTVEREATRALRASERRLRAIFEHCPLALVSTDADGRVVDANDAFASLLGSSVASLRDLPLRELPLPAHHTMESIELLARPEDGFLFTVTPRPADAR